MTFQEILNLHPKPAIVDRALLAICISECLDCSASCTACADASLSEDDSTTLRRVIRLCLDCTDLCDATRNMVARQTDSHPGSMAATVEACRTACIASAEECERHASHHEHCRLCAAVCRRCAEACVALLEALA